MPLPEGWCARLAARRSQRNDAGLVRRRALAHGPAGVERQVDGKRVLSFASNDYLGLAAHSVVRESFANAAQFWGLSSGASQYLGGMTSAHRAIEMRVAEWLGTESALYCPSGYQANLAIQSALLEAGDLVVHDRLNHASLLDATQLAGARLRRYLHADPNSAEQRLTADGALKMLITDAVFSMDGDVAPLGELATVAERHEAVLLVDEAHAIGVLGDQGRGLCDVAAVDAPLRLLTLGKALGGAGAVIAGRAELLAEVEQSARSLIYTTATPPAVASASLAALELAIGADDARQRLRENIALFREHALSLGLGLLDVDGPIQPVIFRSVERVNRASQSLAAQGIYAPAIRPPTVPAQSPRLRITLTAAHSQAHIERLLQALEDVSGG